MPSEKEALYFNTVVSETCKLSMIIVSLYSIRQKKKSTFYLNMGKKVVSLKKQGYTFTWRLHLIPFTSMLSSRLTSKCVKWSCLRWRRSRWHWFTGLVTKTGFTRYQMLFRILHVESSLKISSCKPLTLHWLQTKSSSIFGLTSMLNCSVFFAMISLFWGNLLSLQSLLTVMELRHSILWSSLCCLQSNSQLMGQILLKIRQPLSSNATPVTTNGI